MLKYITVWFDFDFKNSNPKLNHSILWKKEV